MSLPTTSAMQRYIFEIADLEYIKGSAKNPNYERPAWLNQKNLAERIYSFNKIMMHFKAIDGNDGSMSVLSPTRSVDRRARGNAPARGSQPHRPSSTENTPENSLGFKLQAAPSSKFRGTNREHI